MQYRTITPEQLKKLDYGWKCRVMKEIIKGNVKYVEFNQLDMDDVFTDEMMSVADIYLKRRLSAAK